MAPSYLNITSKLAGSAAERACNNKHKHYTKIKASGFLVAGLAFETLGPWCKEMKSFIDTIGKMLIEESGDIRAKQFLCIIGHTTGKSNKHSRNTPNGQQI